MMGGEEGEGGGGLSPGNITITTAATIGTQQAKSHPQHHGDGGGGGSNSFMALTKKVYQW